MSSQIPANDDDVARAVIQDVIRAGAAAAQPALDAISEAYMNHDVTIDGNNWRTVWMSTSAVDAFLDKIAKASHAQQITAGGVGGWISGYLFMKFGKPVLYMMGSTLILILVAEHQGYLTVDWKKFRSDYSSSRRTIEAHLHAISAPPASSTSLGILARKNGRTWLDKLKVIARTSPYLTGGYIGGVLLGLAS